MALRKALRPKAKPEIYLPPYLWILTLRAVGSDLKNEITDASALNEFLCWMCRDMLGSLMVRDMLLHRTPGALCHHDRRPLYWERRIKCSFTKRGKIIVCAFLHDSAVLFRYIKNVSPRPACYIIFSPGPGRGRPAVGFGALLCSCAC